MRSPLRTTEFPAWLTDFWGGARAFLWSIVFSTALGLAGLLEALVFDDDGPSFSDYAAEWVFGIILLPAIVAAGFLLTLALFVPTRGLARDALRHPVTVLVLALIGGAFLGDGLGWPAAIPVVMILVGGLIGSVTGLYTQDLGPQPWLGLLFIAFSFSFSLAYDSGEIELPTSWIGWTIVAATAVYALREAAKLWRREFPRVRR